MVIGGSVKRERAIRRSRDRKTIHDSPITIHDDCASARSGCEPGRVLVPTRRRSVISAMSARPDREEWVVGHDHKTIRTRIGNELTVRGIGHTGDVGASVVGVLRKRSKLE
jgi:hypothetical protein